MTKSIFFIFLLISINMFAQAKKIEEVEKAIENLRLAMLKPTTEALQNIAAEGLIYVHSSGTVRDKKGFVDEFMKGQTILTTAEISDQHIQITGNVAIVRHRFVAKSGRPTVPDIDIIILQTWKKQHGKWLLLGRQAAKIPVK